MRELPQSLLERIAQDADAIERERELTPEVLAALHEVGAFRALIPARFGGLELPFAQFIQWLQTLARLDASTAWCVSQGAVIGTSTMWLSADQIDQIWRADDAAVANGPPLSGELLKSDSGYLATGRWGFSSGCRHATTMAGAIRFGEGWRFVFVPKGAVTFHDDWQVSGLRGTASFQFSADALPVPAARVADMAERPIVDTAFYRIPVQLVFAASFAAVALGVARHGLDIALDIASGKKPIYAALKLKDDAHVQRLLGEAEARYRAAVAYLETTVADVMDQVAHQSEVTEAQRLSLRMVGTYVIRQAAEVMKTAYDVAGSTGIYTDHPLHRPWQDMQVITQHVQGRYQHLTFAGRMLLGHTYEYGPMT